ncbi:V-set domain containing T-cell activation inhibitor 1-like isoform X2 [Gymnodraco acuticeps]|uniref:V-set domain containing T-cell activation inhibitor 1-like isoform X2 n=1 Tax=Gymnodraco acuticeps TaxID=8218 RepID=A0A6P8UPE2_GYMAC|nr:V-set domain containing T-cell activation inhibitor 1-like isoform X2 [Gymnodraco acuticeps]
MGPRALLLATVVFCSESSVHGSPEKVCVSAGGVVILPCSFPLNDVFRTLEWSKTDLKKVIVFLFRDNREDLVEQSPLYVSRTNLSVEDLKSGNASLRISNIQAADAGTYQCMRMWKKGQENITEVELFVVGGFTLECEATTVGSDAEITFLDENGKNLSADDPKKNVSRGCYTVQRVTLQEAASRVTCRVQRADTNETRETKIQLPVEEPKSCSLTALYTVVVTVLVTVVVTVLVAVFVLRCRSALVDSLWRKCCKTEQMSTLTGVSSGESACDIRTTRKMRPLRNYKQKWQPSRSVIRIKKQAAN